MHCSRNFFTLLAGATLLAACQTKPTVQEKPKDILSADLDNTTRPSADFFQYANGGWISKNPIPGEESSWGIGNLVINENLKRLKVINLQADSAKAAKGTPQQKIGDFWHAAMDSANIEAKGLTPLQPYFEKIEAITDTHTLMATMAYLHKIGVSPMLSLFVMQDEKNSEVNALYYWQSGLYLPEREYYLKKDNTSLKIIASYQQLITHFLTMSGVPADTAAIQAARILQLETSLAKVHRKREDLRDPYKNYHKMATTALYKLAPNLDMPQYLQALHAEKLDSIIIGQPEYYTALSNLIKSTPIDTWKALLRFRLIDQFSDALPNAYGVASFQFKKLLTGATERKPRWKRTLLHEEDVMGELLGQLFVKEYFNATAKKRYEDLVEAIRNAYKIRIQQLTWMSDSTKQKALVKLFAIKKKVGYPDKWKDFSSLDITPDSYVQNLINGNAFWIRYNFNKLGKPVNRDEWDMTPQTYNAYYNPSNNEIVLPAGIFTVPGYRDEQLDDALVYGYAGASTIGHEITHGFDDQGRQFDEKGNLKNWWNKADEEKFNTRAEVMVKQFNNFLVIDTFKINGKATLGENIADLGGILLGWDAFQQTTQFKHNDSIGGLSPAQRYFLGYGLGWLQHNTNESLRNQALTDAHAPAKFRVNGPFQSVDAFYKIFNVQPTDKMYLPDSLRVHIW
ncbi:putative endopeptidase [Chitinophaga costaii]|uniref:Putative endopeptidase n=1 Tax=Chitinophaga costaii TaxID=1335309 RepID=A0A1C4CJN0_9BACT|nr:M13 family metallopeptidase [Chitinophaga costaii]PUZ27064.1 M13 family peptidase [Chitinophaga costaii]SCC19285.1 putative endopeptidase [Chitinophaga costaii]